MALLFYSATDTDGTFEVQFRAAIKTSLPTLEVRTWPEIGNASEIRYAALWLPPKGLFKPLINLTHIFALSAGVDRLLMADDLPKGVPIFRLEDGGMSTPMSEYVLMGVLQAQRQMPLLADAQANKRWQRDAPETAACDWHVGILGAGVLASAVASRLVQNGYRVSTWSRTQKNLPRVQSFAGPDQLQTFCSTLNTLVCLLPLTAETQGLLNTRVFNQLPKGASLINAARGEHCVDEDLIAALDSGQVSSALLDVFHEEPLPESHPFWSHPKVQITPHIAAPTAGDVAAKQIAQGVTDAHAGRQPGGLVDRKTGY